MRRFALVVVGLASALFAGLQVVLADYRYDSPSMSPCYVRGQLIFVNKLAYSSVTGASPQRRDTVVAMTPRFEAGSDSRQQLVADVRRLIAFGGETVKIHNGAVYVDGQELQAPFDRGWTRDYQSVEMSGTVVQLVVPAGDIYLLGENPSASIDSRTYGPVPATSIVGKLIHACSAD